MNTLNQQRKGVGPLPKTEDSERRPPIYRRPLPPPDSLTALNRAERARLRYEQSVGAQSQSPESALPPVEAEEQADEARPTTAEKRLVAWWALPGALLIVVVALALLLGESLRQGIAQTPTNLILLKGAMQAAAGTPPAVGSLRPGPGAAGVSGTQARALARIAEGNAQPAQAEEWLRRGLSDPRTATLTRFELCRHYWAQGARDEAAAVCRGNTASGVYWLNLGLRADQAGDRQLALDSFEMATLSAPNLARAWQYWGQTLFAENRYEEAIVALERTLALDSAPPAAVFSRLAEAYRRTQQPEMARDVLNRGLALRPDTRELYLGMATLYREAGDPTTADGWYVRLLQRWPQDAHAWAARGEIALELGNASEAVSHFREATRYDPVGAGYWLGLAAAAAEAGNESQAVRAYEQALLLLPDAAAVWLRAGAYFLEHGFQDRARATLEHALALNPNNDEALRLLNLLSAAEDATAGNR